MNETDESLKYLVEIATTFCFTTTVRSTVTEAKLAKELKKLREYKRRVQEVFGQTKFTKCINSKAENCLAIKVEDAIELTKLIIGDEMQDELFEFLVEMAMISANTDMLVIDVAEARDAVKKELEELRAQKIKHEEIEPALEIHETYMQEERAKRLRLLYRELEELRAYKQAAKTSFLILEDAFYDHEHIRRILWDRARTAIMGDENESKNN